MHKTFLVRLQIVLLVSFAVVIVGCGDKRNIKVESNKRHPYRFWVVLDLSDRILASGQVERDKKVINTITGLFKTLSKRQKFINSHDAVGFAIAEQKPIPYADFQQIFVDSVSVDLSRVPFAKRRVAVESFERNSKSMVDKLYQLAKYATDPDSFPGANIPEFFADHLKQQVNLPGDSSEYFVFVLTDGYPYVNGAFSSDVNNLPVFSMKKGKVNVMLLEINPNNQDINRYNQIKHQWYQWLTKIGVNRMYALKYSETDNEKKRAIEGFVENQLTDSITNFKAATISPITTNTATKEEINTKNKQALNLKVSNTPDSAPSAFSFDGYFSKRDGEEKAIYFLTEILKNETVRSSAKFRDVFNEVASFIINYSPDHKSPGIIYSLCCTYKPILVSLGTANLSRDRHQNLVKCLQKCP
jgi:hypothetical protein